MSINTVQLTMPSSDYFVLKVLQRANGQRVTYKDIAEACEIGFTTQTVWRALSRLELAGHIKQLSRSSYGCIYEVKGTKVETS